MSERVVVLAGEGEYGSDQSLIPVAQRLRTDLGVHLDYRTPSVLEDMPDFPESSFGDLSPLDDAELLIVYTRFRRLPDAEMEALERYLDRAGNVLGMRTSSHAFRFSESSAWASWNATFGPEVLGTPWVSHHGRDTWTEVRRGPGADEHPILRGLPPHFRIRSWLYRTRLEPDCRPLLFGHAVGGLDDPVQEDEDWEPLAWTRERGAQRVFHTTAGHPEDLESVAVQDLLVNAARWLLRR